VSVTKDILVWDPVLLTGQQLLKVALAVQIYQVHLCVHSAGQLRWNQGLYSPPYRVELSQSIKLYNKSWRGSSFSRKGFVMGKNLEKSSSSRTKTKCRWK